MSKFSEQNEEQIAANWFFCALVLRCSLKTFQDIKNYIIATAPAKVIFQRYSTDYLRIEKAPQKGALDT